MEMIVVKSINVVRTPNGPEPILREICEAHAEAVRDHSPYLDDIAAKHRFWEEAVRGRSFVNRHGDRVCIGLSRAVAETLGLEFECWEKLEAMYHEERGMCRESERAIARANRQLDDARRREDAIQAASWRLRLKWLFTGVKW